MIRILVDENSETAIIQDKNTFIQLLVQEFLGDLHNTIIDKRSSIELLSLVQIKDKDLYIYYCQTKYLLKEIHR